MPSYWKEGNVLFNDATYSTHLLLYGVGHMVKDHSNTEKRNPQLPLHRLLFLISIKGSYMHHATDRIVHTTIIVTPNVESEIAQWVHREGSISRPIAR